jgi:ADP-ribose pyrophosphatase
VRLKRLIEVIRRESCFDGFLHLARYHLRHSLFAGGLGSVVVRERLESLQAAAALLYDPRLDQVVLVEQFRIGALERGDAAWTLEPVGGVVAPGEDPAAVIRRESREEAGCEILDLEPIGRCQTSPGTSAEQVWLYCGRVDASSAGGVHGLAHEGEETRVTVLDAEGAIGRLFSGGIDNATAIIALQWLALNRLRLRARWGLRSRDG